MLFNEKKSLEEKMTAIMEKCEELVNIAFRVSGRSFMSVMEDMNAETGVMLGAGMELYKDVKELFILQTKAMDHMVKDLGELKEMNENLCKQNEELRAMLQDLSREVKKSGK